MSRTHTRAKLAAWPRVVRRFALAPRVMVLALALLGLTFSSLARAQQADNRALARAHFQRGVERANANAYSEALREFSQAYQLSPHYSVLYNIGQAHVALGHAAQAVDALKRYLGEGGANLALERRQEVEAEIIRQFERTGTLEVRVDTQQASVAIDGEPRGLSPLAGPVRVDAGQHQVVVKLDSGQHSEQSVSVAAGDNLLVEFRLGAPAPPPSPAAPPSPPAQFESRARSRPLDLSAPRSNARSTLGLAIGAAGVGLGGAAVAHFLWNRSRHRDWQTKYDHYFEQPTPENREDANQLAESIPRANVVTLGLALGAGLALGTGTFLLVTDTSSGKAVGSVVTWRGVW